MNTAPDSQRLQGQARALQPTVDDFAVWRRFYEKLLGSSNPRPGSPQATLA